MEKLTRDGTMMQKLDLYMLFMQIHMTRVSNLILKFYRVMVVNANFNNISVVSLWSVLLVEETGVAGKNHQPAAIQ
jgi:hypothetical protein